MKTKFAIYATPFIVTGFILLIMGLYYSFFKSGLPYLDPTPEMTVRWLAYNIVGEILCKVGWGFIILGCLVKITHRFLKVKK